MNKLALRLDSSEVNLTTDAEHSPEELLSDEHSPTVGGKKFVLGASTKESAPKETKYIFKLPVNEGVTTRNIIGMLMVPVTIMLLSTYVNAQTIMLLKSEDYFNIEESRIGKISGSLTFVGLPFAVLSTFGAGFLFDILGRRKTLFLAFCAGSCLLALIPVTAPKISGLMTVRALLQLCFSAPAANPLLADYIRKDAIGKANAIIGFAFLVGEILSMGVLFNVTKGMSAEVGFAIVAMVGIGCSTQFLCLVKEPQIRDKASDAADVPKIDIVDAEEDMPSRQIE